MTITKIRLENYGLPNWQINEIIKNQKTVSELKDYLVFTDKEWVLDGIRKLKEDAEKYHKLPKIVTIQGRYNEKYIESEKIVELLKNPDSFVSWQKQCVCDFENNKNTHSLTCKARFQKILGEKK